MSRSDNERIEVPVDFEHVTDFTGGVNTTFNGEPCRMIEMAEAGTLTVVTKAGTTRTTPELPQWHRVFIEATSIPATQTAAVIVYY